MACPTYVVIMQLCEAYEIYPTYIFFYIYNTHLKAFQSAFNGNYFSLDYLCTVCYFCAAYLKNYI